MNSKPMEVKKSRNANYKLLETIKAFVPGSLDAIEGTCANIKSQIEGDNWNDSLGSQVSAPYALARLCALYHGLRIESLGQESYKCTWQTILLHPETGHVVTFYDYKGGISFGSDISGKDTPKSFIRDLKKLLKVLKDDRCPHPYDGCVVGEGA